MMDSFSSRIARFFFFSSHSQILITDQPRLSKRFVIALSCSMFRVLFFFQYSAFSAGLVLRQSWPCQKHPSTKIAIRLSRKTKSGWPLTLYFLLHPVIWLEEKYWISFSSVLLLPEDLTPFIISDLLSFENTSAIMNRHLSVVVIQKSNLTANNTMHYFVNFRHDPHLRCDLIE